MIAVLYTRKDSIYKSFPDCDVYDIERNASTFQGDQPVIAHPPCRAWGRLRAFAKPRLGEKELAFFAIEAVRKNGGILEHPAYSTLWKTASLPLPGQKVDEYGGYSISVDQFWFGHKARKNTWLYIVNCPKSNLPDIPLKFDAVTHVVQSSKRKGYSPHITKAEREITPVDFAKWLIETAKRCFIFNSA